MATDVERTNEPVGEFMIQNRFEVTSLTNKPKTLTPLEGAFLPVPKTMIEVFKTNVELEEQGELILASLTQMFSALKINFDLDDCDRILRVEGHEFSPDHIRETIHALGFTCVVFE